MDFICYWRCNTHQTSYTIVRREEDVLASKHPRLLKELLSKEGQRKHVYYLRWRSVIGYLPMFSSGGGLNWKLDVVSKRLIYLVWSSSGRTLVGLYQTFVCSVSSVGYVGIVLTPRVLSKFWNVVILSLSLPYKFFEHLEMWLYVLEKYLSTISLHVFVFSPNSLVNAQELEMGWIVTLDVAIFTMRCCKVLQSESFLNIIVSIITNFHNTLSFMHSPPWCTI